MPDAPSSRCWPHAQARDRPRCNLKAWIGILLLVFIVVALVIIILTVTRDSVGTLVTQVDEHIIEMHEPDWSLKLQGEDSANKPVQDRTSEEQGNEKSVKTHGQYGKIVIINIYSSILINNN